MNGAAQAHADTPVPPIDNELASTQGQSVRDRILSVAYTEFDRQNPGTFYSEGVRQAWCANFVSWVMRQAGDPLTNVLDGSWRVPGVYTLKETFAAENKLEPVGYKPSPGDVVLYGGSGHTNIVVGVDGDNITTIGGNEGNRISQRTISRFSNNIMGFGRVDDAPAPEPEPAPAPAPEFMAPPPPPPVDPFLPPPPAPEFVTVNNEVPPPAPADEVATVVVNNEVPPPPPAPEFVAVNNEVPPPPVDPFLPPPPAPEVVTVVGEAPPPPAPEFVAVNNEVPPPPPAPEFVEPAPEFMALPADPFLPPPPVEFLPPAPEVVPAVFDAPPPPVVEDVVPLDAPAEGLPHLSGAAPGPAL